MRCLHLDLNWQHYRFEHYLDLLERAAGWGYNAILLEYGDMFPFTQRPEVCHHEHWTLQQVRTFCAQARQLGIEVIPLVQTLGHLGVALRRGNNFQLCEDPTEQDGIVESICPSNPEAVRLVRDLVSETLEAHPESRFVNLGGDEALMGVCRHCKRRVSKLGKGRHYAEHMNIFIDMALAAGKRPIVWADCLEHHPDGLNWLRTEAILGDWLYESVGMEHDWASVRAGDWSHTVLKGVPTKRVKHGSPLYWAARGGWSPIITKHTIHKLPAALRRELAPYLSFGVKAYPDRFHGFPYLRYLKNKGFDVIYATAIKAGDTRSSVDYDLHLKNCLAAAQAVAQAGGIGVVTTSWAASGFTPLESQYLGMAIAARAYEKPGQIVPEEAAAAYERKTFGKVCGLLNAYRKLTECSFRVPTTFTGDRFEPLPLDQQLNAVKVESAFFNRLDELERLAAWTRQVGLNHREIEVIHYATEELRYKYRLALVYNEWRVGRHMADCHSLRRDLQATKELFCKTFRRHFTPRYLQMELQLRFAADEAWLAQAPTKSHEKGT